MENKFIKKLKKYKWLIIALVIIVAALSLFSGSSDKKTESKFATVTVTRGNLRQIVSATGEIQPINTIKVGSQVSGIIEEIRVDYNAKVKKGDILLKIDPTVLQATAEEAKASLISAQSQRNLAKSEYERSKSLYSDGFIARAEIEQSQTNYETANQAVKRAQSQYDRAKTNLGYATITSPVDGTVISRKVDKGQTVAASFQSPDLFEIAEDLSKMQIEASVSEADIGMIKEGQTVTFTVDAYPTQKFVGNVSQIRLSPITTSNVVVYTVVIEIDNSDMRLMPGMTAFVTVLIDERSDVLKASNSAFLLRNFDGIVENPGDLTPKTSMAIEKGKDIKLVPYKKGLITPTETEIISDDIQVGDKIITGVYGMPSKNGMQMKPGGGIKETKLDR